MDVQGNRIFVRIVMTLCIVSLPQKGSLAPLCKRHGWIPRCAVNDNRVMATIAFALNGCLLGLLFAITLNYLKPSSRSWED